MGYDWEELLAADKVYIDEELIKDLDRINKETNKEKKYNLLSAKAAEFSCKEKLNKNQFLEKLNTIEPIFKPYGNHKFPQANNINLAFILIEYLMEYRTENYQYITSAGLSLEMGFSGRQGNYYGDLLHYLGFLDKRQIDYSPTKKLFDFKNSDQKRKLGIFIYSFLEHETFVKCFKKYYLFSKSQLTDYTDILKDDPLLSDFKNSTIIRRESTVKAIIRWVDNYLE